MSEVEKYAFISDMLARPLAEEVHVLADHIVNDFKPGSVEAILTYGSCLRGISVYESLVDFYVIVDSPQNLPGNPLLRWLGRVLPPNVYYAETRIADKPVRAKYAVVDTVSFAKKVTRATGNPYFWARFAQPTGLVWSRDEKAKQRTIEAISSAMATMAAHVAGCGGGLTGWRDCLVHTYATELRAEGPSRAEQIVKDNQAHYETIGALYANAAPIRPNWFWRRIAGKSLSVARLVKAAFTFAGGADYLAWKISRHSGVEVKLTEWQRRHPILAAVYLLPSLLRKGAVR